MLDAEITPQMAANILRVTVPTIHNWMATRKIREFRKYSTRKIRIPRTEIDRIVQTPGRTALIARLYALLEKSLDEVIPTDDLESLRDIRQAIQYAQSAHFAPYDMWGKNIDGMRYHLVTPRLKHPGVACLSEATGLLCGVELP